MELLLGFSAIWMVHVTDPSIEWISEVKSTCDGDPNPNPLKVSYCLRNLWSMEK